jgi:hypothetical protein
MQVANRKKTLMTVGSNTLNIKNDMNIQVQWNAPQVNQGLGL